MTGAETACKILLQSRQHGQTTVTRSDGAIEERDGEVIFRYKIDGDDCTLTASKSSAKQVRRGKTSVEITFEEGKITSCQITDGGFTGVIPVATAKYELSKKERGYTLKISYYQSEKIGDGAEIALDIAAVFKNN